MARRSTRLAPATTKARKAGSGEDVVPEAPINIASMNRAIGPRPTPRPIKPGALTFLDIPGEIRNQIYGELLPDKDFQTAATTANLRKDARKTSTMFMATCHQVYEEAVSILYPKTIPTALRVHVDSAGTTTFLQHKTKLCSMKPYSLSATTRATRLSLQVEVRKSFQATSTCDVQDAMFNLAAILKGGHQLEGISLTANIAYGTFDDYGYYGYWGA